MKLRLLSKALRCQIITFAQLIRFDNCAAASAYTLVGAYLSGSLDHLLTLRAVFASFSMAMTVAFACAFNDYSDVLSDTFGKPKRPIPSGRISARKALSVAMSCSAIALAVSALLGMQFFSLTTGCLILSALYSYKLKGTCLIGNVTVSVLLAVIPVYGGLLAGEPSTTTWVASGLIFLFALSQEVLYTAEDEEADRLANLKTTATYLGLKKTVRLYEVLSYIFFIGALAPWFLGMAPMQYLVAISMCTIIPMALILSRVASEVSAPKIPVYEPTVIWFSSLLPLLLLK